MFCLKFQRQTLTTFLPVIYSVVWKFMMKIKKNWNSWQQSSELWNIYLEEQPSSATFERELFLDSLVDWGHKLYVSTSILALVQEWHTAKKWQWSREMFCRGWSSLVFKGSVITQIIINKLWCGNIKLPNIYIILKNLSLENFIEGN